MTKAKKVKGPEIQTLQTVDDHLGKIILGGSFGFVGVGPAPGIADIIEDEDEGLGLLFSKFQSPNVQEPGYTTPKLIISDPSGRVETETYETGLTGQELQNFINKQKMDYAFYNGLHPDSVECVIQ